MCASTCGGFTPSPNPRDVSRARQRRSTWLGKRLPVSRLRLPSCLKGGRDDLPYSCGTAPDSNRLRLFSPGIRTMGTPDVQYSVAGIIQAGTRPVQMRMPRVRHGFGGEWEQAHGRPLPGVGGGGRRGRRVWEGGRHKACPYRELMGMAGRGLANFSRLDACHQCRHQVD